MATITIKRRKEERKDGRAALYAVFNVAGEKIRVPVDIAVSEEEWDPVNELIKGRSPEVKDKNLIISNTKAKINDIFVRARLSGEQLTKQSFFTAYNKLPEDTNFITFAHKHLRLTSKAIEYSTFKSHRSILKKLEEYQKDIPFSDITPEFLRLYTAYMRKLGNEEGTVWKNISTIKVYILAAIRAGMVKNNPFEVYKVRHPRAAVIFLTEEELNKLISLYKSGHLPENEMTCLRFFLFLCFTSLHISDAKALTIEQIFGGEIHYKRKKTRIQTNVPLSTPAMQLFEYYRAGRKHGKLFTDLPSDQAINRIMKQCCKRVGITKRISAKAARHTFATLYYKKNQGDIATLSNILGHSSLSMTMKYAHIMKENRAAGIHVFDDMEL